MRPGGVVAVVTSSGTMDKKDSSVREYLANRADLVGAVRLPNNAFQRNANTGVVADILFLQKRDRAAVERADWVDLCETPDGYSINQYFAQHPEMVLGEITTESTQYGKQETTVKPIEGVDLAQQLREAVSNIHATITELEISDDELDVQEEPIPADPSVKNFSFTNVDSVGKIPCAENRSECGQADSDCFWISGCVYRTWKGECRNMIAAYQRISRADGDLGKDGKDKSNSIENQKELILRYISCKESLQNVPVMDFVDDGYTGSNFDRPGFQRMMDGVRNGKIDTIIVKDLSRFGRDYIGVGEYMEQIFPLLGVRLIAINDNYDSNNYKGTTLGMDVVVSNLVNTMYCRDAGKKLRTANQVKWRKGITTASAAPFGYQFDPDKKGAFIIDPPAAKIVRRIFDLAILGLGTREIAMMLNDENVPVPSVYNKENKAYGKETTYTIAPVILWDSSRVWKILTAYVYTGAMVLGKTKTLISGKSIVRTVPKGQQFITEGTHEAIVSREEFEKAQLVIKSNSHKVLMGGVDFPLKGKVRCGNCRRVMAHNFKQVVPTFWCREGLELVGQTQCTSEIFQVSDIESAVFQALKKELSLLDSLYGDIQKEEQALKEAHKRANRRKTLMEQELKNLKGEKMRMYEEYAAGTLPLDTYKQKKQECDRRISEVQEQIEQSKAEESAESVVPGTVRAAAEQAENFLHGTRLTAGMVSAFIENVFVHDGGRIVVRFKYEQSIQDAARALHKS